MTSAASTGFSDELMGIGLRPVVELSFMPRDPARDPAGRSTARSSSPPKDWDRWGDLVAT